VRAVQFGAGNIGRGFLGQLYFESGYTTTFIDVNQNVIHALNTRREYPVSIVGEHEQTILVSNVQGVLSSDADAVSSAIVEADIAATSVGVTYLADVAKTMAPGIAQRLLIHNNPLDIILCENKLNASEFMRAEVRQYLPEEVMKAYEERIGFVDASIGRMVPVMTPEMRKADPLRVCVEAYCDLPVDALGFKGPLPPIKNLLPKTTFEAYVERKLFLHNAGHAAAAYLGYLRGHEFIWQAMADPRVRPIVDAVMTETCNALSRKYGTSLQELLDHAEDLKHRFQNKALGDQVARVGGDPWRKLGPEDRLIGALKLCAEQKVEPRALALAIAAAMRFDPVQDKSAKRVQDLKAAKGSCGVLVELSGLPENSALVELVLQAEGALAVVTGKT
jgi:mannitol-1-phosphate 5-dehydrogenase